MNNKKNLLLFFCMMIAIGQKQEMQASSGDSHLSGSTQALFVAAAVICTYVGYKYFKEKKNKSAGFFGLLSLLACVGAYSHQDVTSGKTKNKKSLDDKGKEESKDDTESGGKTYPCGVVETQGNRPEMEDDFAVDIDDKGQFFGVYDGHAGKNTARAIAGKIEGFDSLHKRIKELKKFEQEDYKGVVAQMQKDAEAECGKGKILEDGSGSTVVMAYIHDGCMDIVHAGDSRAILVDNNGKVVFTTKDHSPNDPDEIKRVEGLGGRIVNGSVNNILRIARSIESVGFKSLLKGMTQEPDFKSIKIELNHYALILACDGVFERGLTSEKAAQIVSSRLNGQSKGQGFKEFDNHQNPTVFGSELEILAAKDLCEAALKNGSRDNISAMVIRLEYGEQ